MLWWFSSIHFDFSPDPTVRACLTVIIFSDSTTPVLWWWDRNFLLFSKLRKLVFPAPDGPVNAKVVHDNFNVEPLLFACWSLAFIVRISTNQYKVHVDTFFPNDLCFVDFLSFQYFKTSYKFCPVSKCGKGSHHTCLCEFKIYYVLSTYIITSWNTFKSLRGSNFRLIQYWQVIS